MYHKEVTNKLTLVEGGISIRTRLAESIDEPYELFLDVAAVRRLTNREERNTKAGQILKYIDEAVRPYAHRENQTPSGLDLCIGFQRQGYGVYGMYASMPRPQLPDQEATRYATLAMRHMAHDLGTYADADIPGMVYAHISRQHGMTFETNPIASSSMDTDGQVYEPDSERIELYAHNLYTHEMQLICISGIISLMKHRPQTDKILA